MYVGLSSIWTTVKIFNMYFIFFSHSSMALSEPRGSGKVSRKFISTRFSWRFTIKQASSSHNQSSLILVSDLSNQKIKKQIGRRSFHIQSLNMNVQYLVGFNSLLPLARVAGFKEVDHWSKLGSVISRFMRRLQHGQLMWPQWHWNIKSILVHISFANVFRCPEISTMGHFVTCLVCPLPKAIR